MLVFVRDVVQWGQPHSASRQTRSGSR
jgi:hypothetical protein